MKNSALPVFVSIATIPSRIGSLKPTIDSLLAGDLVPNKIFIVRPDYCKWEESGYDMPDFLLDPDYCRGIVETVVASRDFGSSTKVLGVIDRLEAPSYLVIADDDVLYDKRFLAGLVEAQAADHRSSFSYYTYRAGGLTIATGCDGVTFYTPNLKGMFEFAQKHVIDTTLMYHDDLWIGFFLYRQDVAIRQVPKPSDLDLIYTQVLPNDVLSAPKEAHLQRQTIFRESLSRLVKNDAGLTRAKRLRLAIINAHDLVVGKLRHLLRR